MAKLGVARLSVQFPVASGTARLEHASGTLVGRLNVLYTLKSPTPEQFKINYGFQPIFIQNPHFDPSKHQNLTQNVFTGHIHYKTLKHTQVLRLPHQFINNSPIHQASTTFNNNNKSHHNSSFQ
jgi:hypothetical protein